MSYISVAPGGRWRVRWRDGDRRQRSQTFDSQPQALEFQQRADAGLADGPMVWTVYRAYCDVLPLGLYETREAARAHCLDDADQHGDDTTGASWFPVEDEVPDGEEGLLLPATPGTRMYSVLPLDLMSDYDPSGENA